MQDILVFKEQYFERIWGGHSLRSLYGMPAPEGRPVGEAWLISDHPSAESVVADGPSAGQTLHDLMTRHGEALMGRLAKPTIHGRFPLLLKLLDARDVLSVQVHPDDAAAQRLGEPDVGKTEMWHVLHADPGSTLICGLDPEVDAPRLAGAINLGDIEELMIRFPVAPGDSVFVPAGTVHAIGAGNLLAEIQQNSDLTYRLYDWGRVDDQGNPRQLHVEKSLAATRFGSHHSGKATPLTVQESGSTRTLLAACRYFTAERLAFAGGACDRNTRGDSFHILLGVSGSLHVQTDAGNAILNPGKSILIPSSTMTYRVSGNGETLLYYVADLRRDVADPLAAAGHDAASIIALGGEPDTSDLAGLL
jgi:mannose-6-phosphate isomerase